MRKLTKKIIIYSMVAMMQVGLGTAALEASPRSDWQQQHNEQQLRENQRHEQEMRQRDGEDRQHWNDRMWRENQQHERWARIDNERQYRNELEMERHEREMQRRQDENDQAWNDRLYLENQYHDQLVAQIEADLIVLFMNR
jgi:hypothetical protein